ncbi:RNA polymerase sigma factor, sigma-70 family [Desulfonispora thiosulfatigenes DSM 11270]|uniref:RNA polymerase sigma factor, sigma-70 family n=1 Tax=Desulfonispora thiosulfatigenes DSM 11270 TaxID=656914 RepID=A0A1W1V6A8_DESTI|nr:sigma-70 family RNA polymerase sigma factor [Desulfonispora thiosulfatigenes]SMB88795.1 RNA polymerase sigma factor, sigma-70 family [Desulfonispora thiosulfatigenes DSM 11270]
MLKTNKDMKKLGRFLTRTPKKEDFTEYVYSFVDGTKAVIPRSDLSAEVDELLYTELKRETNNNEVQIEKHRSYAKEQESQDILLNMQASDDDVEEMVLKDLESEALRKAIQSLLPRQKRVIFKKYFLNKTNTLIGKEEGVTEGAIRATLKRAHKNLQKQIHK